MQHKKRQCEFQCSIFMVIPKYPIWSFDASINHKSLIENIFCFVFNRQLILSCIDVNNPNNPALHLNKWNFAGISILYECFCSIFNGVYVQIISICLFFLKPISNQLASISPLFAVAFIKNDKELEKEFSHFRIKTSKEDSIL